jgi:hypothetical protein
VTPRAGLPPRRREVPTGLLIHAKPGQDVVRGYDAAGRVAWQVRYGSAG